MNSYMAGLMSFYNLGMQAEVERDALDSGRPHTSPAMTLKSGEVKVAQGREKSLRAQAHFTAVDAPLDLTLCELARVDDHLTQDAHALAAPRHTRHVHVPRGAINAILKAINFAANFELLHVLFSFFAFLIL